MAYKDPNRMRQYQAAWCRRRREEWILANGPCESCGSDQDLEVDHREPDKKVSSAIWSWAEEKRTAELAKCRVLCKACHMAKSVTERAKGEDHGSAKLTEADVIVIRASSLTQTELARQYGVDKKTIWKVVHYKTWTHITRPTAKQGA